MESFRSAGRSFLFEPFSSFKDFVTPFIPRGHNQRQIDEASLDSVLGENSQLSPDLAKKTQELVAKYLNANNVSDERIQRVFVRASDEESAGVCGSFKECGWHLILLPRAIIECCELEKSEEKAAGMAMLSYCLAHECAHIALNHHDVERRNLATLSLATYSVFFAASRAFLPLSDDTPFPDYFHHLVGCLSAKITRVILVPIFIHRKYEFQADQLYDDLSVSLGACGHLSYVRHLNLETRNSPLELSGSMSEKAKNICDWMYRKCRIASNGDSRSDFEHPPISQRLRYFENKAAQHVEANRTSDNPGTIYI